MIPGIQRPTDYKTLKYSVDCAPMHIARFGAQTIESIGVAIRSKTAVSFSSRSRFFPLHRPLALLLTQRRTRAMATAANGTAAVRQKYAEGEAAHVGNGGAKINAWSSPGRAAFDFRSTRDTKEPTQMIYQD